MVGRNISNQQSKKIVLTGASSGIGRAAALQLAADGHQLLLVARRADELAKVCDEITAADGTAESWPCDLADFDAIDALADAIQAKHGKVDVLINNAGRSIRRPIAKSFDRFHDFERTMHINYFALVRLTLKLVPAMLDAGNGHVINITTWGTLTPSPKFGAYVASKCAVDGFTKSLDCEMRSRGVAGTTVHYPIVTTPMIAPTQHYKNMPSLSAEQAGRWIVKAVNTRHPRITARVIAMMGISSMTFPKISSYIAGRIPL